MKNWILIIGLLLVSSCIFSQNNNSVEVGLTLSKGLLQGKSIPIVVGIDFHSTSKTIYYGFTSATKGRFIVGTGYNKKIFEAEQHPNLREDWYEVGVHGYWNILGAYQYNISKYIYLKGGINNQIRIESFIYSGFDHRANYDIKYAYILEGHGSVGVQLPIRRFVLRAALVGELGIGKNYYAYGIEGGLFLKLF